MADQPEAALARPRVLVVDDDDMVRATVARIFRGTYELSLATDGRDALDQLARERFDLILADIRMPRMGGYALYETLVTGDPEHARRVVFMTGDPASTPSRICLEVPRIDKPFERWELRAFVVEALCRVEGAT